GSIAGAADRLFRTPSAITRQVQRLEAALGAELLDRSVKPPRLNSLGSRVLEQARDVLQRTEALNSLVSSDAKPHGVLRKTTGCGMVGEMDEGGAELELEEARGGATVAAPPGGDADGLDDRFGSERDGVAGRARGSGAAEHRAEGVQGHALASLDGLE